MTFFDYLKNIFFLLILLQITPSILESIRKQYGRYLEPRTSVGVLSIKGVLYDSSYYSKHLQRFFKEDSIKAILLKMECPGSASGTGYALFNEIQTLKQEYQKPIIVLVENICASGGLWIACAADYIIAPSTALIGSIGVYFPYLFQLKNFIEDYKIRYESVKAGTYKTVADPFVDITPEERALLQSVLDDTYQQFTQSIAKTRKLPITTVTEWADGKIFTGSQAHKLGLIDEIGSAQNAIKVIKEKALIEGEIEWVHPPKNGGFLSKIFGGGQTDDDSSMFTSLINTLWNFVETRCSAVRT